MNFEIPLFLIIKSNAIGTPKAPQNGQPKITPIAIIKTVNNCFPSNQNANPSIVKYIQKELGR